MAIVRKTYFKKAEQANLVDRSSNSFFIDIDKRDFSAKRIFRKHPILAGFHRGLDGAIVGVVFCAAFMTALALHSQYLWTLSFSRLEKTRDLNQRIEKSITNIENYFLASTSSSRSMVTTQAKDLLYLDAPTNKKSSTNYMSIIFSQLISSFDYPIKQGY